MRRWAFRAAFNPALSVAEISLRYGKALQEFFKLLGNRSDAVGIAEVNVALDAPELLGTGSAFRATLGAAGRTRKGRAVFVAGAVG